MHLAVRTPRRCPAVSRDVMVTRGVNGVFTPSAGGSGEVGARSGVAGVNATSVAGRDVYALSDTVLGSVCFAIRVGGLRLASAQTGCRWRRS